MLRERDDHPINRDGYPGIGPVPRLWSQPQACWRFLGTVRAHPEWLQLDFWLGRPLPTVIGRLKTGQFGSLQNQPCLS